MESRKAQESITELYLAWIKERNYPFITRMGL